MHRNSGLLKWDLRQVYTQIFILRIQKVWIVFQQFMCIAIHFYVAFLTQFPQALCASRNISTLSVMVK